MKRSPQIVHQRHIHKRHIHKHFHHKGLVSLANIMGHRHSHNHKGCGSRNHNNHVGGTVKKHTHQHKKPLHFKSLF